MKSVLQAGWLLTVAFGNVIVLIVAEGAGLEQVHVQRHGTLKKDTFFHFRLVASIYPDCFLNLICYGNLFLLCSQH